MNNTIGKSNVEKLNQLKAEQERIEKELAIQEELAKNDSKKIEAIESANKTIASQLQSINTINTHKREFFKQLQNISSDVTITETTKSNFETPYTYLRNEQGESERWEGDQIPYDYTYIEISYKGIKIGVEEVSTRGISRRSTYKMTLSETVTGRWNSKYTKAKTVINKINEYLAQQQRKTEQEQANKLAYKDGLAHLKSITPKGTKIEQRSGGRYYSHSRRHNWISWQEFHITLPNGNSAVYKVTANRRDNEPSFTLSLLSFKDTRIEEVKKTPETLINYLK